MCSDTWGQRAELQVVSFTLSLSGNDVIRSNRYINLRKRFGILRSLILFVFLGLGSQLTYPERRCFVIGEMLNNISIRGVSIYDVLRG